MGLMELLPAYYKNSAQVIELQSSFEHWTEFLNFARDDMFLQLNIDTATWGLELWEKYLGLEIDVSKSREFRRERIKAKIRGTGTVTKQMIENVAKSYSNGEVNVIEDTAGYSFNVKFVGTKGIPENMADLKLTIEEIKPAHLAFTFEYTWMTWDEFDGYNKVFDQWDTLNLTWDELETYLEKRG